MAVAGAAAFAPASPGALTRSSAPAPAAAASAAGLPATTVPPTTPPTGGFPNAGTTGPRPGVLLTPSGSLNITQDGAVLQNLHVTGTVRSTPTT